MTVQAQRRVSSQRTSRPQHPRYIFFLWLLAILCSPRVPLFLSFSPALAQETEHSQTDLSGLSLEELMNIEVTSVGKKSQKLSDAAAAIYVITQEDIRRSGATSIPEVLRMVPGLQVAQIDSNKWAVAARGFNDIFTDKLLVLIDGRSVYTPLYSGVFWDVQDTILEDIERIEVIRGPGATLWGANAVNGVINIITKTADETQGGLVTNAGGSEEQGSVSARYGGKIGDTVSYRVYAKYFDRDRSHFRPGGTKDDAWNILRGGFRFDWRAATQDRFTLQGDLYDGDVGWVIADAQPVPPFLRLLRKESNISGGNLLGRWRHAFSEQSQGTLQMYYDRTRRDNLGLEETRDTVDLDWQHEVTPFARHSIVWGAGYRLTADQLRNAPFVAFSPASRKDHLFSAFIQDEITLIPDRLRLTLGSKFEHNDYTGFEAQPSIRFLWTPHRKHTLWAAVSRAVRTPSRINDDVRFNIAAFPTETGLPALVTLFGSRQSHAEELLAYELGYRSQLTPGLTFDATGFYMDYTSLSNSQTGTPTLQLASQPPYLLIPQHFRNEGTGRSYGIELASQYHLAEWWRLQTAYTWLEVKIHPANGDRFTGTSPHHQVNFRSMIDLPWRFELDTSVYYVDTLSGNRIPSYFRWDVRLGWHLTETLELSLVGQNLSTQHHREFQPRFAIGNGNEIERSAYGKLTWRF